jgi:hypothetical protein
VILWFLSSLPSRQIPNFRNTYNLLHRARRRVCLQKELQRYHQPAHKHTKPIADNSPDNSSQTKCRPTALRLPSSPKRQNHLGHCLLVNPPFVNPTPIQARQLPRRHPCLPSALRIPRLLRDYSHQELWLHILAVRNAARGPGYCLDSPCIGTEVWEGGHTFLQLGFNDELPPYTSRGQ